MPKRRWIYIKGEAYEVGDGHTPTLRDAKNCIVGDSHYDGLRSPIDGADISTRAKHQEYMKRNDLCTIDDFKGEWEQAAKKRAAFRQGHDPNRIRDVVESVRAVEQGYRPKRYPGES